MRKMLCCLSVCWLFFSASMLHAQEIQVYYGALGAGLYGVKYVESRSTGNLAVATVGVPAGILKAGVDAEYWGAEVRLGLMGSASKGFPVGTLGSAAPFSVAVQAGTFFSYLGKLQYPFNDAFKVYALLGGTMASFSIDPTGNPVLFRSSAVKTGFTYGLGLEYKVNSEFSVDAEWIRYWSNVAMSVSAAGVAKASFGGVGVSVSKSFDF